MIFKKAAPQYMPEAPVLDEEEMEMETGTRDEVETVVGPSVNVEGDFASEGNIVVKGTVAGSDEPWEDSNIGYIGGGRSLGQRVGTHRGSVGSLKLISKKFTIRSLFNSKNFNQK
jgi:hypothetical protein